MKRINTLVLVMTALLLAASGCKKKEEEKGGEPAAGSAPAFSDKAPAEQGQADGNTIEGMVVETMDSGGYTYVRVQGKEGEVWAAGPQTKVVVGDRIAMPKGMVMKNFSSDSLGKTFEAIVFTEQISVVGRMSPKGADGGQPMTVDEMRDRALKVDFDGLEKAEGGLTVEEVLTGGTDLVGKQVKVRGKVVKINRQIMERNWLHIQDGTGAEPNNDLTVTSQDDANAGDTVLIVGTVARNSATFHGGPEKVVVEKAKVTVEVKADPKEEKAPKAHGAVKDAPNPHAPAK